MPWPSYSPRQFVRPKRTRQLSIHIGPSPDTDRPQIWRLHPRTSNLIRPGIITSWRIWIGQSREAPLGIYTQGGITVLLVPCRSPVTGKSTKGWQKSGGTVPEEKWLVWQVTQWSQWCCVAWILALISKLKTCGYMYIDDRHIDICGAEKKWC